MDDDRGLRAAHAARVVAVVSFRCECDVQPAHGAVLQEVSFDTEKKWEIVTGQLIT